MRLHIFVTLLFSFLLYILPVQAQETPPELDKVDVPKRLLPEQNLFLTVSKDSVPKKEITNKPLDRFQKDVLSRITDVYRFQIMAMEAQVEDDWVQAETNINNALAAIQQLLDDYPEIQDNRRFAELYRSVLSEYEEFYGIEEPVRQVQGEVFSIREQFFEEEQGLLTEEYRLPENIKTRKTDVPLVQNNAVNRHLVYYTLRRPEVMETWLTRYEKYGPMLRRIFKEEGLPEELVYLSFIESGLNPKARSWAAAVGMWQFIRATGSVYGLESNWWIDERRDPEKATRAAARHLKDLYNIWGDWHLAMANYNISPRGLKRAIRRAGGKEDYWAAYPYLPRETRGYVPGFIATTMIAMNPEEFGFKRKYENEPYEYEVVEVRGLMQLDVLAEAAGITVEELKDYNPELLRWATPPGNTYPLKIPVERKESFIAAYQEIPKEQKVQNMTVHVVNKGETLGTIANKYGTSVRGIYESNSDLGKFIYPGQKLVIPLPAGSHGKIAANRPSNQVNGRMATRKKSSYSAPANSNKVVYTVKKNDTVGHIAEWYDVRAWQIRTWNGIGNTIRVGQKLTVYVPKNTLTHYQKIDGMSFREKQSLERQQRSGVDIIAQASTSTAAGYVTYTVKPNDTLSEIADGFGVPLSQLRNLNNLNGSRIYPGQKLRISRAE